MDVRKNMVLQKLKEGRPILVGTPTPFNDPQVMEIMGLVGYDCAWIDLEHQNYDYNDVINMCMAARTTDLEPMIRIRKEGMHSYFRAFECGGTGIMVPHVMNAEDAKWVVRNSKFAPLGLRGMDGVEPPAKYTLVPGDKYFKQANEETFIAIQIEDKEAVDCVEEIAKVPNIDILFVGPGDLTQSYGVPLQFNHPSINEAIERVAKAAKDNNKYWGIPAVGPEMLEKRLGQGALFFATGAAAVFLLVEGYKKKKQEFDNVIENFYKNRK